MTLVGNSASSMPSHRFFKVVVFVSILFHTAAATSTAPTSSSSDSLKVYKKFIKDECNATTYPSTCYKSLSPYASKIKKNRMTLTLMSVNVALKAAKNGYSTLKKLSNSKKLTHDETLVIADCRENMGDTVDLLTQSAQALAQLINSVSYDRFQWDTIKTWMSAAITDESTCTDEFDEMQVRPSLQKNIKTAVTNIAWTNSNALNFVNRLYY